MSNTNTAECKGCGKTIVWAKTTIGKYVPLDPKAIVYVITSRDHKQGKEEVTVERATTEYMTSHFNTCPNADDFSASKKKTGNHTT